jgi:curli production assembly/transport component CsgF
MLKYKMIFLILLIGSNYLWTQQMVYTPLNPDFGGSYFNGSYFLSLAQAQNEFTEKAGSYSSYETDPLKDFKESLNRQILNQLSRDLMVKIFGEDSFKEEGRYEIGDYVIDIIPGGSGISITIQDITNGSSTTISVPYY